jgi:hypothetical protein
MRNQSMKDAIVASAFSQDKYGAFINKTLPAWKALLMESKAQELMITLEDIDSKKTHGQRTANCTRNSVNTACPK